MKLHGYPSLLSRVRGFAAALCLSASLAHAQNFTGYDLLVPKSSVPNAVTVVDGTGVTLPTNRSFVIGIEGGLRNPILFRNWTGTAAYPIVITNRHGTGRVEISDAVPGDSGATPRNGIAMEHCKYIQLRGDNDPSMRYGIHIARAGGINGGSGRRGVDVYGRSSDVEISFLEIQQVSFAGIMVKEDPNCDPTKSHPLLVYRNISVHDNYIHDVGGEALYIGYSFWTDDKCLDSADAGYAHNIEGLRIFNNLLERAKWDGIQVGAATSDVDIHNNVIVDAGLNGGPGGGGNTGVGVQLGAGTTGLLRDNLILRSRANGISMFGIGHNIIYNNLVYGGTVGIFIDNRPAEPAGFPADRQTQPGTPYYLFNNTFVGQSNHVMWTMSEITDNQFKNNLVVAPNTAHDFIRYENGATGLEAGNVFQRDTTGIAFADPANFDYRLLNTSSSSVLNQGVTLSHVPADFQGIARPQGSAYDSGYSEAGTLSVFLATTPPTGGSSNGSITASAINGTAPYSYAWSTGATTATISGLAPGLYSVTVTDAASNVVEQATYLFNGASLGAPVALTPPTQVRAPIFAAPAGTYAETQAVTLSSATAGATIRYTTDGSTPTDTHGTIYTGPITVSATGTVKAVAYKTGLATSNVAVATYFIGSAPATPTLSVASVSDRRVALSWTPSPTATRYELLFATTSGGPYTSLGVLTTTSFTHHALTNGATYYYVVNASNLYGTSADSPQTTATPFPYPTAIGRLGGFSVGPTTTQGMSAEGGFDSQIGISWNATTQRPEGDDPLPHSDTDTNYANRFWVIDFTADYAKYHIVEMWTRYRPSSPGNMPGFATWWWDDDIDIVNDGVTELEMNFQTAQGLANIGTQQWVRDRDFGVAPIVPLNRYLVIGTGSTITWRPNEFALFGWEDGSPAAPTIAQQPVSQTVPQHSSVSFTVAVTGSPEPSYQWRKNGVDIPGQTGPWLYLANVLPGDAATYSVVVTNASGSTASTGATLTVSAPTLTIVKPATADTATGSAYCGAGGAFNEPPAWDANAGAPVGFATMPHTSTSTAYANRYWFIDFGPDYAQRRISQMWTRYRPNSPGNHPGFATMWWDDDNDTINDGITASSMNFNTAQSLPNVNTQLWVKDRDFTASPLTPQGRYLVVSVGPNPDDRPNEFAFVGYQVP